ncbi:HAMP domain-containing histidine kinase [Cryptosporangium phraense]|uniref:histidine kinase n=1 Tax=Cryptosporangium phraense TaxID=2593070 RepID=A0A545AZB7_9ACTN|nr:HAMP domain-containing histidine kinase [Cryptosporangium phraense]
MPLGVKLVAALVVLLSIALLVTGVTGTVALRGYLIERLDHQIRGMAGRYSRDLPETSSNSSTSNDSTSSYVRYQPPTGRPVVRLSRPAGSDQSAPDLPTLDASTVGRLDETTFTVGSVSGGRQWRVLVRELDDGRGTLVIAISFDNIDATVTRLVGIDAGTGVVTLLALVGLGWAMVRSSLRRLREVETVAEAIAGGDLSQRVPPGGARTEVGRLATALNSMLEQIETAFAAREASEASARASEERMRRFVADASHELRTPLTSIRGFSELYRQGAVPDDREAVDRVMQKIEAEALRMGLLVDDLMLLARLDQQRPIEARPVDVLRLAIEAVEGARIVAPTHPITLRVDSEVPLTVIGDGPRLRQVLDNLISNATIHTPDGTPVEVRLGVDRRDAVVAVSDQGPGLTPEQAERVFERFYRTDPARSRAHGGSGLGLSIVAALVAAHGGTVRVETAPGEGATFRVRVPLEHPGQRVSPEQTPAGTDAGHPTAAR